MPGPLTQPRAARRALLQRAFAATLCLLLGSLAGPARAVTPEEVKAAYLFRFTAYVEWPPAAFESADSPIVIGVADAPVVLQHLRTQTQGKRVGPRPVAVRGMSATDEPQGLHVVYLGAGSPAPSAAWLERARASGVLVVANGPQGLDQGAALSLVQVSDRVRFEVSLKAAAQAGLKLSSRLLAVADRVEPAP